MSDGKRKINNNNRTNKKKGPVTVKDDNKGKEIAAVILCGIGLFMLFSFFDKTGPIGRFLTTIFFGLFGRAVAVVVMLGLFVIAWKLIRRGKGPALDAKNMTLLYVLYCFFRLFCIHSEAIMQKNMRILVSLIR